MRRRIKLLEGVQRRFTKRICELKSMSYNSRLRELGALSVQNKLLFGDMTIVHRCVYGQLDGSQFGLSTVLSNTRANGVALIQRRAATKTLSSLFSIRAPSAWNKLPSNITNTRSLAVFKKFLFNYLLANQS